MTEGSIDHQLPFHAEEAYLEMTNLDKVGKFPMVHLEHKAGNPCMMDRESPTVFVMVSQKCDKKAVLSEEGEH